MLSDNARSWLQSKGISSEEIDKRQLDLEEVYIPSVGQSRKAIKIPFIVDGAVVGHKFIDQSGNYVLDCRDRVFNLDGIKDADTLYLADNETEVMALSSHGFQATCPPDWQDVKCLKKLGFLQNIAAEKKGVTLLLSRTEQAILWERTLSHFFVRQKSHTVTFPENCISICDVIAKHGAKGVQQALEQKCALPLHGVHSFADYSQEIEDYYDGKSLKMYSTGFPNLDRLFKFQPGNLTVITGVPSSGKSQVMDQLIINTIRDHKWNWCIYSPEMFPPSVHFQNLSEKLIGSPMFGHGRMSRENVVEAINYLHRYVKIIVPDEGEKSVQEVLDATRLAIMKWGINAVLYDPYNSFDHVMRHGENEVQYISRFLSAMRNFARVNNVWVGIISHPTKIDRLDSGEYRVPTPYDIAGASHWRNKCDCCLCVWRPLQTPSNEVTLHVQKVRSKYVGQTGSCTFTWERSSGRFTPKDDMANYLETY